MQFQLLQAYFIYFFYTIKKNRRSTKGLQIKTYPGSIICHYNYNKYSAV